MSRPPRARSGRQGSGNAADQSPSLAPSSASASPSSVNGFSLSPDSDREEAAPVPALKQKLKERNRDATTAKQEKPPLKTKKVSSNPSNDSSAAAAANGSASSSSKVRSNNELHPGASLKRKTSSSPSTVGVPAAKAAKTLVASTVSSSKTGKDVGRGPGASSPTVFAEYLPVHDPVTGETLFCVCRRANDGEAMICCDVCEEWYHLRCIGLSNHEAARLEHFVCARCKLDPVRGREENKRRKRIEEERKGKQPPIATQPEKRSRRRDKNGVEERDGRVEDEDMGDGSGKWIKKDAGVDSESDEDEEVYMTSDDEDAQVDFPKTEQTVKQEPGDSEVSPAEPTTSFRAHHDKQPRVTLHTPSFARPDHRLHPLIRHTPRVPPPIYPPSSVLHEMSRKTSASLQRLVTHPYYLYVQSDERALLPSALVEQVQRLADRWSSVQTEYEEEEEKRQLQLSGEEWRLQQLLLDYRIPHSESIDADYALAPQPSPIDLLLSSALPLGLGHPRFLRDTQLVVTSANDFSSSVDAFHSQPHTPAAASAAHSGHPPRPGFRFTASKRQAADCVAIESVYCMGCEGWIPLGDYVAHVEECCLGPITTPDQRLMVVVPYEEGMEEQVRPDQMHGPQWTLDHLPPPTTHSPSEPDCTSTPLHTATAANKGAATAAPKNGLFSNHSTSPPPAPVPSAPSTPAGAESAPAATSNAAVAPMPRAAADPELTTPALSALPAVSFVTRFHRFLNPDLFSSLMCGYPLLCGLPSSPSHTHCRELRTQCPDHSGWEIQWRDARRRRRRQLGGRLESLREDMEDLAALMDQRDERWRPLNGAAPDSTRPRRPQTLQVNALRSRLPTLDSDAESRNDEEADADDGDEVDAGGKRRDVRAASLSSSTSESPSSSSGSPLQQRSPASLLAGGLSSAASKKEKDRERVRERERINKQRQRERAKQREREKEARAREKERSREKKRERKRRKKAEERERKASTRDRDRDREREREREREHGHRRKDKGDKERSHKQSKKRQRERSRDDSDSDTESGSGSQMDESDSQAASDSSSSSYEY